VEKASSAVVQNKDTFFGEIAKSHFSLKRRHPTRLH
jgi:hypothetical protein